MLELQLLSHQKTPSTSSTTGIQRYVPCQAYYIGVFIILSSAHVHALRFSRAKGSSPCIFVSSCGGNPASETTGTPRASENGPGWRGALLVKTSGNSSLSARLHTDCAIQPDYLAIEHGVFDDVFCQGGVFGGAAQARREGYLLTEGDARRFRQARQQRGIEEAGGDGHDANAVARKLAGDGQRHADDAAL